MQIVLGHRCASLEFNWKANNLLFNIQFLVEILFLFFLWRKIRHLDIHNFETLGTRITISDTSGFIYTILSHDRYKQMKTKIDKRIIFSSYAQQFNSKTEF